MPYIGYHSKYSFCFVDSEYEFQLKTFMCWLSRFDLNVYFQIENNKIISDDFTITSCCCSIDNGPGMTGMCKNTFLSHIKIYQTERLAVLNVLQWF